MKKIEFEVTNEIFDALSNYASKLNLDNKTLCQQIITTHILVSSQSLPDHQYFQSETHKEKASNPVKKELVTLLDTLKKEMGSYSITQADLASYLNVTQSAISLALGGKNEKSILKQRINLLGLDKFLLQVFKHKYLKAANELIKNWKYDPNLTSEISLSTNQHPKVTPILEDWPDWKKIFFSYVLSTFYTNVHADTLMLNVTAEHIDGLISSYQDKFDLAEKHSLQAFVTEMKKNWEL